MTIVDTGGLAAIQQEVKHKQSTLPMDSLDWNIYQGQLDLLDRVNTLVHDVMSFEDILATEEYLNEEG